MEQIIGNLHNEFSALSNKIDKLDSFIKGEDFKGISETQKRLLKEQHTYMLQYQDVLKRRLDDLSETESPCRDCFGASTGDCDVCDRVR